MWLTLVTCHSPPATQSIVVVDMWLLRFFLLILLRSSAMATTATDERPFPLAAKIGAKESGEGLTTERNRTVCEALLRETLLATSNDSDLSSALAWTYTVTSSVDLVTLNQWKLMAKDFQCKMLKLPNPFAKRSTPTQYCTNVVERHSVGKNRSLYGLCVPADCTETELDAMFLPAVSRTLHGVDLAEIGGLSCSPGYQKQMWWKQPSVYVVATMVAVLLSLVAVSSLADFRNLPKQSKRLACLRYFSVFRNRERLFYSPAESIFCLNGIKVISMNLIMLTHLICFMQSVISDLDDVRRDFKDSFFAQYLYNGTFRVATFFVISSIISSHSFALRSRQKNETEWRNPVFYVMMVVSRYLRLFPMNAFTVIIVVWFLPYLSHFPTWHVVEPTIQCAGVWWMNLLYINNLRSTQLCLSWTWYLACDFQLYLFHLPLVVLLTRRPKLAATIAAIFMFASVILKACLVIVNNYFPSLMLLVPVDGYNQDFATYTFTVYMRPYGWWGTYLVGILAGHVIASKGYRASKGWYTATMAAGFSLLFWCLFGLFFTVNGWKNTAYDFIYAGFTPIAWGLGWCMIVFACDRWPQLWLNRFLSHKMWRPLANLTYSCYLIHCIVIFGIITEYALHSSFYPLLPRYSKLTTAWLFIVVFVFSYGTALVLFFVIEAPFNALKTVLLRCIMRRGSNQKKDNIKMPVNTDQREMNHLFDKCDDRLSQGKIAGRSQKY